MNTLIRPHSLVVSLVFATGILLSSVTPLVAADLPTPRGVRVSDSQTDFALLPADWKRPSRLEVVDGAMKVTTGKSNVVISYTPVIRDRSLIQLQLKGVPKNDVVRVRINQEIGLCFRRATQHVELELMNGDRPVDTLRRISYPESLGRLSDPESFVLSLALEKETLTAWLDDVQLVTAPLVGWNEGSRLDGPPDFAVSPPYRLTLFTGWRSDWTLAGFAVRPLAH